MTDQSSIISLRRKLEKEAWEIKSLGEIATEIVSGKEVTKVQLGTGDYPAIKYSEIFQNRTNIKQCINRVNPEVIKSPRYCKHGDLLIAKVSENEWGIGKTIVYLGNEKPVIGDAIIKVDHNENSKFLLYLMSCEFVKKQILKSINPSTLFNLQITRIQNLKIPLPPRHIQDLIAESLDKWTEIEEQLEKELNRELEQRKKQYEYYKETIFNKGIAEWTQVSLDKVAIEIISGNEVTKAQLGTGNYPAIKCGDVNSKFKNSFTNCVGFVNPDLIKSKVFCEYGDVLVGALSNTIERIGITSVYLGNEKPIVGSDIFLIKHKQNSSFLSYILGSEFVRDQMKKISTKGAVVHMYKTKLHLIKIPLPSLEEQNKIVEILDKLRVNVETLQNEIPKLIHKLRKQYIYYKEQIISTEPVSSINTPTAKIAIKNSYIW